MIQYSKGIYETGYKSLAGCDGGESARSVTRFSQTICNRSYYPFSNR